MAENNIIGIVGKLTETPRMTLDAKNWKQKIYETMIEAERESGAVDTLILEIPAAAVKAEEEMQELQKGVEVLVIGEIHTQNNDLTDPTEPKMKIFIKAWTIVVNEPPARKQNAVVLKGNLCKDPRTRQTRSGLPVTDIVVAVNDKGKAQYIPCVCWNDIAVAAAGLTKGDYVEIEGAFQSREYKKKIEGAPPFLMTAYEVTVIRLGMEGSETEEQGEEQ